MIKIKKWDDKDVQCEKRKKKVLRLLFDFEFLVVFAELFENKCG